MSCGPLSRVSRTDFDIVFEKKKAIAVENSFYLERPLNAVKDAVADARP